MNSLTLNTVTLSIMVADITTLEVDAIVNAANSSLLGGGGVDGAIHRGAGPDLVFECRLLGGCKTGDAKITRGYQLPASHIIHTVGPVWRGGTNGEAALLAACYRRSLEVAVQQGLATIAFPAISTGIFAYPADAAAMIAVNTVADFVAADADSLTQVTFCCFSEASADQHRTVLAELAAGIED